MIHSIKVTSGYAKYLPGFKRTFKFTPGLNILFGDNGSGKSTILKILAAYSSIRTAGWSRLLEPLDFGFGKIPEFPKAYSSISPGKCAAKVKRDGSPVFFFNASATDQVQLGYFVESADRSPDGMMDMQEQILQQMSPRSSGQHRLVKLHKMMDMLAKPPDLSVNIHSHWNSTWAELGQKQAEYHNSLGKESRTLLMDEPDKALSLVHQVDLWTKFLPGLAAQKVQVIVATHSPFALNVENANYIECTQGYLAECREAVKGIKL